MAESKQVSTDAEATLLGLLHYSQKEAARFLQIGYLSLRDFPEIAEQIRLTAEEAQTQHLLTTGLIKEYEQTANYVINVLVVLLKRGIKTKAKKTVENALKKLYDYVTFMITETKDTQNQYASLKNKVQRDIACVEKEKTNVKKEGVAAEEDIHLKTQEIEQAKEKYNDLENETTRTEKEIDELCKKRYAYLDRSLTSPEKSAIDAVIDHVVIAATTIGMAKGTAVVASGAAASLGAVLLPAAMLFGGWTLRYLRRKNESTQAFQASETVAGDIKLKLELVDRNNDRIQALEKESLDKIKLIRKNLITKAYLGNPESLVEVKRQLEKVGQCLEQMLEIWCLFSLRITKLRESKDSTDILFIGSEENPEEFAVELEKSVENITMVWQTLRDECSSYAEANKTEKRQILYGFLTESQDELNNEDCNKKRDEILAKMESDLKDLCISYPRRRRRPFEDNKGQQ